MKVRGAAAILVDAAIRDVEELRILGLPIWTRFIRAKGATKTQLGQVEVPVTVGGTIISPGDIIVLDEDGGVCVQLQRAEGVLNSSEARVERESKLREKLLLGQMSYDLHGLREFVETTRSKEHDCR